MSVFTSQIRNRPYVWQITVLSCVFGALLAASLKTQDRIRGEGLPNTRPQALLSAYNEMKDTVNEQKKQISDLQANLTKYQSAVAKETGQTKLLYDDLKKSKAMAGLVAVTGPGVTVTLRDAKNLPPKPADMNPEAYTEMTRDFIIHDQDIQTVVNELRAAGAEAIAINDQRVVGTTAVRCVGPVVQVNGIPTNGSPVKIKAIGDADTMLSALTMANGVRDQYAMTDPGMFGAEKTENMTLPAYSGATPLRYAQVAPDSKAEAAQRASEKAGEESVDPIPSSPVKAKGAQ